MSKHQRKSLLSSKQSVEDNDVPYFVLRCLKALYGLVDGPLMWQIALLTFMKEQLHESRLALPFSCLTCAAFQGTQHSRSWLLLGRHGHSSLRKSGACIPGCWATCLPDGGSPTPIGSCSNRCDVGIRPRDGA